MAQFWNFLGYISFSTFEGFAVFALSLFIFRYNFFRYFWPCLLMNVAINLQSYFIRNELSLTSISPILNLLIIILFLAIFIRIPILGAAIMSLTGYAAFVALQTLLVIIIENNGMNMEAIKTNSGFVYSIQTLSGVIGVGIGWVLYYFGYGFSYGFLKRRFKWEKAFIVGSLLVFLISLGWMMYYKAVYTNLYILSISLLVFLYYSFRKETAD